MSGRVSDCKNADGKKKERREREERAAKRAGEGRFGKAEMDHAVNHKSRAGHEGDLGIDKDGFKGAGR